MRRSIPLLGLLGAVSMLPGAAAFSGPRRLPKSNNDPRVIAATPQSRTSRQQQRRELFERAMASVNDKNKRVEVDKWGKPTGRVFGLKRAERRNLARAYAYGVWKQRAQKAVAA